MNQTILTFIKINKNRHNSKINNIETRHTQYSHVIKQT